MSSRPASSESRDPWPRRHLLIGAAWFVLGLVVTLGSIRAAGPGGSYLIAWGALVGGLIEISLGLWQLFSSRSR